jgi:hypothetical protein
MKVFTFNERKHIGWSIKSKDEQNMLFQGIAFIIYVEPNANHHFEDGEYPLPLFSRFQHNIVKCERNTLPRTRAGPILFAIQTPTLPVLLFQTGQQYIVDSNLPPSLSLMEYDIRFFDREAVRDLVQVIADQPVEVLLPFHHIIFEIASRVEQHRLIQAQKEQNPNHFLQEEESHLQQQQQEEEEEENPR